MKTLQRSQGRSQLIYLTLYVLHSILILIRLEYVDILAAAREISIDSPPSQEQVVVDLQTSRPSTRSASKEIRNKLSIRTHLGSTVYNELQDILSVSSCRGRYSRGVIETVKYNVTSKCLI